MEKKTRVSPLSSSSSSKGLVCDSKKKQDNSNNSTARNPRRVRESSSFTNSSKVESNNRHQQNYTNKQLSFTGSGSNKYRFANDKRFVATHNDGGGGYPRNSISSTENPTTSGTGLDSDDDSETIVDQINYFHTPGGKKQSGNHLINFQYAPIERSDPQQLRRSNGGVAIDRNIVNFLNQLSVKRKQIQYNREKCLHASCQFVVKSNRNYTEFTLNPDERIDWEFIEQIFVHSTERAKCPICLCKPTAGKMAKCGHIFCYPCILHYLSLTDREWRKCPICYDGIYAKDLKSVVSTLYPIYNCGDYVTLQLMCRDKRSLQVTKAFQQIENRESLPHLFDAYDLYQSSKLILANVQEILSIIDRERKELKSQLLSDGIDCPESMFIQQSLSLIEKRQWDLINDPDNKKHHKFDKNPINTTVLLKNMEQLSIVADEIPDGANAIDSLNATNNNSVVTTTTTTIEGTPEQLNDQAMGLHLECNDDMDDHQNSELNINETNTLNDSNIPLIAAHQLNHPNKFYFYQAIDGQHLYLHAINVRMLQAMYGSLENAPSYLECKILQKQSCSMSEALRKRLKYLQHLPISCQFDVVEVELKPPIISENILKEFHVELMQRQSVRQKRERQEIQREKHINEVNENKIKQIFSTPSNPIDVDLSSIKEFPSCNDLPSNSRRNRLTSYEDGAYSLEATSSTASQMVAASVSPGPSAGVSFSDVLAKSKQTLTVKLGLGPEFAADLNSNAEMNNYSNNKPTIADFITNQCRTKKKNNKKSKKTISLTTGGRSLNNNDGN